MTNHKHLTHKHSFRIALRELQTVNTGYNAQYYTNNTTQTPTPARPRVFSKQKTSFIEQTIAKRINNIGDSISIENPLKYAFDVIDDDILNKSRDTIIDYCLENDLSATKLSTMGKQIFCDQIMEQSNDNINEQMLHKLYDVIGQYNDYMDLKAKLEEHQGSCCVCDCNHTVINHSFKIYQRDIYSRKMILQTDNQSKSNKIQQPLNQQIKLNQPEDVELDELKYGEESPININSDQQTPLEIIFNDDHLIYAPHPKLKVYI